MNKVIDKETLYRFYVVEEKTMHEISQILHISVGSVFENLTKALKGKNIQKKLEKKYP